MKRGWPLLLSLSVVLFGSVRAGAAPEAAPRGLPGVIPIRDSQTAKALWRRFDDSQARTRTLAASFVERKRLHLLVDEQVHDGRFFYTRPDLFLWEYTDATGKRILLSSKELLVYYPGEKKAEQVDISRYSKRILRFFGLGQTSSELRKYYDLTIAEDLGMPDAYLLFLDPNKRRLRRRLDSVRIWVDRALMFPRQIEYVEVDGDSTRFTFSEVEVNAPVDRARYDIKLPPDTQISRTFSGILAVE